MPIFDFECPLCGKVEERLVSGDGQEVCECGSPMERLLSVPGPAVVKDYQGKPKAPRGQGFYD